MGFVVHDDELKFNFQTLAAIALSFKKKSHSSPNNHEHTLTHTVLLTAYVNEMN